MRKKEKENLLWVLLGALIIVPVFMLPGTYTGILRDFIPFVEGFSPVPIWDYNQWSWGYGTAAGYDPNKKPPGTIDRNRAMVAMLNVVNDNYNYLSPYVTKKLSPWQWAALLSFSYNVGPEGAKKVITTINTGDSEAVAVHMRKYKYAGGQVNQGLVNRREKEIALYNGNLPMYGKAAEFELEFGPHAGMVTDHP